MSALTTALVGLNVRTLAPAPVAGHAAETITVINLDTASTVMLGSSATNLAFPVGPLASMTLTAPVYAKAATVALQVGIAPGGSSYSPGSLTITGPVNAEITGPVTVEGTVDIGGTVDVAITGTPAVTISGNPVVDINTGQSVAISGTPAVTISGTPVVDIGTVSGSIDIATVAGSVNVDGVGGIFPPGGYASILNDTTGHSITYVAPYTTAVYSVQSYQSFSLAVKAYCPTQATPGAPLAMPVQMNWFADAAGTTLLETDTYWMWLSNSSGNASACPLLGGGPARGAYVSLSFYCLSLGVSIPLTVTLISLSGNGRSLPAAKFCQSVPSMSSGITYLPSINPAQALAGYPNAADGILANEIGNSSANASATYWLPLPLFSGPVSCRFETTNALANDFVLAQAAGLTNGGISPGTAALGTVWNPGNTAAAEYTATLQLGNCPLYAVIRTAATIPTISLVVQG